MRRLVVVLVTVASLLAVSSARATAGSVTGFRLIDVVAPDGVVLKANVIAPTTPGRHPGIVFINSWGVNDAQYVVQATELADKGYVVLSYTSRGWWGSGGAIEVAGPEDSADLSAVIDWMVDNTAVDTQRIGAAGVSYGSGIALLGASLDPRVRAVAAMSTWADMNASLYGNQTPRTQAVGFLDGISRLTGRPSQEMTRMLGDFYGGRNTADVLAWGRTRSPATYLDAINRNAPAVLLANSYGDSLFPPDQLIDYFNRLTGPKRIEFAPGDHAVVELTGLAGLPNHVWTSVHRWFDRYLRDIDTGIDREPAVVQRPRHADGVEMSPDWASVVGRTERLHLGPAHWWDLTGDLGSSPSTGWSRTIVSGVDTAAWGGVAFLSNGFEALSDLPPTAWLPGVNRVNAGVWVSGRLPQAAKVRGSSRLHLCVTANRPAGTLVAYLYDLDALGVGRLVSHVPVTWLDGDGPRTVDVPFPATGYDVPEGHRLAVVVDTEDALYRDENTVGAPLSFTGPSWVDIALH